MFTYEIGLSGLCELLFSGRANLSIWIMRSAAVSITRQRIDESREDIPGERVPARTWLTSMLGNNRDEVREVRIVQKHRTRRRRKE